MKTAEPSQVIACQQVLTGDGSVFSIQWTVFPALHAATLTPQFTLDKYLAYLRRFTLSLARPVRTANGLEFRFLFTNMHLLTFAAPAFSDEGGIHSVALRICGGPFVQYDQCNRGRFSFLSEKTDEGVKVTVQLADYFPRLLGSSTPSPFRKCLYRLTQAALHKLLTTRFLASLYRELTGKAPSFKIVKAYERSGEDI
jgi:hypothetical protein